MTAEGRLSRRETDDDDGPETVESEAKKKKKMLADLQEYKNKLASTKGFPRLQREETSLSPGSV